MKKIKFIFTLILTLSLSTVLIMFFDFHKLYAKEAPEELYQVYLDGEKVGVIKSKNELENYIDKEQKAVKEKYNVKTVYPPNNLYIQKYISYNEKVLSAKDIYEIIKEKNPFTIKGYVITINGDKPKDIYVLDKDMFVDAVNKTIEVFVPKEDYQAFLDGTQPEIKTTGKKYEDIYIDEARQGKMTIREDYIPVDEQIFTDEKELSRYLLFGTLAEQKKYIVKEGDTIENIAFNNSLGVEEFLLVNPTFTSSSNLLYPGQQVAVGLISPVLSVVVESHVVADVAVKHTKKIEYDSSLAYGVTKTKQKGVDGVQRVTQKLMHVNGELSNNAVVVNSEVLKAAIPEIVIKGTKTSGGTTVVISSNDWAWPTINPCIITSYYGWRWGKLHEGIDISGTGYGSPIKAASDGVIYKTFYDSTGGNQVIIKHDRTCQSGSYSDNCYTIYAHLSKIYVKKGQTVKINGRIGAMGHTGFATGTHVHFGVYAGIPLEGGKSFNPLLLYK